MKVFDLMSNGVERRKYGRGGLNRSIEAVKDVGLRNWVYTSFDIQGHYAKKS